MRCRSQDRVCASQDGLNLSSPLTVRSQTSVLLAWHASRALLATVAPVVIGVVVTTAITHGARWEVSLHPGGIAGSVTVFVPRFGPVLLMLTPLAALVGWTRWHIGAHTVAQAVVATILAVVPITGDTFWLQRVPVHPHRPLTIWPHQTIGRWRGATGLA